MIVKERAAKKMVCPMGQAHPSRTIWCVGRECMAWRYAHSASRTGHVDPRDPARPGFCGLVAGGGVGE